jgi:hypothetical protein
MRISVLYVLVPFFVGNDSWNFYQMEEMMGTIDQPTPSHPKSPQPEVPPLQPGQTTPANPRTATPERVNPQTPDTQRELIGDDKKE